MSYYHDPNQQQQQQQQFTPYQSGGPPPQVRLSALPFAQPDPRLARHLLPLAALADILASRSPSRTSSSLTVNSSPTASLRTASRPTLRPSSSRRTTHPLSSPSGPLRRNSRTALLLLPSSLMAHLSSRTATPAGTALLLRRRTTRMRRLRPLTPSKAWRPRARPCSTSAQSFPRWRA